MTTQSGEISDCYGYDPCYEWPDEDEVYTVQHSSVAKNRPVCRFIVSQTCVLPSRCKVIAADDYPEIQFGRDAQVGATPRVRLKEMQVSKLHATVFWDASRKEWSVVDMGSKHGTFLSSSESSSSSAVRLSKPRSSSRPVRLRHLDMLTIGSTTFLIHIHDNMSPSCLHCMPADGSGIELFPVNNKRGAEQVFEDQALESGYIPAKNSKIALNDLKRTLLTKHTRPAVVDRTYIDRSARRRALYPPSGPDAPGVHPTPPPPPPPPPPRPSVSIQPELPTGPPVTDETPVSSSSFGHRILLMQGWQPGTALGSLDGDNDGRTALIEPLKTKSTRDRAGLGMKLGR